MGFIERLDRQRPCRTITYSCARVEVAESRDISINVEDRIRISIVSPTGQCPANLVAPPYEAPAILSNRLRAAAVLFFVERVSSASRLSRPRPAQDQQNCQ